MPRPGLGVRSGRATAPERGTLGFQQQQLLRGRGCHGDRHLRRLRLRLRLRTGGTRPAPAGTAQSLRGRGWGGPGRSPGPSPHRVARMEEGGPLPLDLGARPPLSPQVRAAAEALPAHPPPERPHRRQPLQGPDGTCRRGRGREAPGLPGHRCCLAGSPGLTPTSVTPQLSWESGTDGQEECPVARVQILGEK